MANIHLGQGKKCKYVVKGPFSNITMTTERALDNYLEQILENVEITGEQAILSVNPMERTKTQLEEVKRTIESAPQRRISIAHTSIFDENGDEVERTFTKIENSIGVSEFISRFGNYRDISNPMVTPMNIEAWKQNFREKNKDTLSEAEIEELIRQQEEDLWPSLTAYGTNIHEIIDATFKKAKGEGEGYKRTSETLLSDEQIKQIEDYANNLIADLRERHGKKCEFYTEIPFMTKELTPELADVLGMSGYTSINGKADLIVMDEKGRAHIYDFKVSRKDSGNFNETSNKYIKKRDFTSGEEGEWPSSKKEGAKDQLAIYSAILTQYGITVDSASIIPILPVFEYESEYKIKGLKSIKTWTTSELRNDEKKRQLLRIGDAVGNGLTKSGKIRRHLIPNNTEVTGNDLQTCIGLYNALLPTVNIGGKVKRDEVTIESIRKKFVRDVRPNSPKYADGKRFYFKRVGIDDSIVYCTEEELETLIAKYVEDLNAVRADELVDLSTIIVQEMNEDEFDLDKLLVHFNKKHHNTIKEQFRRYFEQPGWTFNSDPTLNSFGIFEFERGGDIEIVAITTEDLFVTQKLPFGTTLLGGTTRNKAVGYRDVLDATNDNLNLMKVMVYLAEHQEKYAGKKILQIRSLNPWFGQFSEVASTEQLRRNYELLLRNNPTVEAKPLTTELFYSEVESLIRIIYSKLESLSKEVIDFEEKVDATQIQDLEKWVDDTLYVLQSKYPELYDNNIQQTSEAWDIYTILHQVKLEMNRVKLVNETSPDAWFKGGEIGSNISAAQFSPSHNLQEFARLHDRYVAEVREQIHKTGHEMQVAFKAMYDEVGVTGARAFESWFRRNPDGSISDKFEVYDPEDPDFRGGPAAKKALSTFLRIINQLQHPLATTEADIEQLKLSGQYYQIPLTEAVFSRQVQGLGLKKTIKNKIDQYMELTEGVFAGDSEIKAEYERQNDRLYNKFALDDRQRNDKLEKEGVGFFETHLEIVFNQVLVASVKQKVSEKYVPLFRGMQMCLQKMQELGKNELTGVRTTLDKLIRNRFYGENIMEGNLKKIYQYLSVISSIFSTMKLGLNMRSFLRETITGMYIGATRTMVKQYGNVSLKSYNEAIAYILQDVPNNMSGISKLQQLNAIYGMANYSLGNIANQRKTNWLNINNWGRDTLFIGCSAPDYQHRMAILLAKMIDDGCWEAFSLDENNMLVYDFKKDQRFSIYNSGDISNPKYAEQRALYLKNIEEWNAQGYRKADGSILVEGDDLPQAYTNREGQSIKNYADILYGHYDDESRSLMNDMFLGSFIMQFKTFVTAKFEQWFMTGGTYNVENLKQQYDPITGEKLYEIIKYHNSDNTGMPYREIIKESAYNALSEEEKKLANPYIEWVGQPMEGMFYGLWNFSKALFTMNTTELKRLWNDPHEKGLFLLGLSDLLLMSMLLLIIKALFAAALDSESLADVRRDARDAGWATSFSYNVITGVVNDNNIIGVVSSMASDINPPLITNLTQFGTSFISVLTGKQSVAYALTRNVGMLSDFSGMIKKWESAAEK